MIDVGSGPPLVLIPGIQGRWEWMEPTVDALAGELRVITGSLPGEPGSAASVGSTTTASMRSSTTSMACWTRQACTSAVICGVSFGGLIALRYAARRPERVRALILVSTPGPRWKPEPHQQATYCRWPMLSSPLFALARSGAPGASCA